MSLDIFVIMCSVWSAAPCGSERVQQIGLAGYSVAELEAGHFGDLF